MAIPILVDTDMALDDWMALAFLRSCPSADLRAITIAATGEAHARPGVRNALRLCALTGGPDIDVAAGRPTPLKGSHSFPWFVRFIMDLRFGFRWPRAQHTPSPHDAVEVLRRQLASAQEPVTIVALGPLTNLAELLTRHPDVKPAIRGIVVMGGALDVRGNLHEMIKTTNNHAEWNIYIDPHAANLVFQSGVPVTLVPLDATNHVPMTEAFFARVSTEMRTPAGKLVHAILKRIKPLMKPSTPFCFWDPITSVLAVHPHVGTFVERKLVVVDEEGNECGRVKEDPSGARIRVCSAVDRRLFEDAFIDGLNAVAR